MAVVFGDGTTSPSHVRRAVPADARALAGLRYQFRASVGDVVETEGAFIDRCEPWMAARLGSESRWRCWVVEVGCDVGGNVWLQIVEKLPNPVSEPECHGYISNLYVQPPLRGAGLGSALLEACLGECAARHVDAIVLWPTPRSRSLYTRYGFAVRDDLMERRPAER